MRKFSSISRVVCLGAGLWLGSPLYAFENSSRLLTYKDRDQTLFALSLATDAATSPRAQLRVAILVDTSASQSGSYRSDSLEIAERFVQSLPKNAEAALFACDVNARLLAKGSASSSELASGLKSLADIVPLGSSDIVSAVRKAKSVLSEGNDGKDLCIVYVGDGIHRFNLIQPKGFESLVNELRNDRTTILSLAIGPKLDVEFLATLANHTGGTVYVHQNLNNLSNQQVADGLAK
nr:VWA domain-containing protein [Pirellula sp.]